VSLGGGSGQQDNELCDAQDTSLSVSGIIQSDDIVNKDITPNLHKESPTELLQSKTRATKTLIQLG
jgi:hypothetical protein